MIVARSYQIPSDQETRQSGSKLPHSKIAKLRLALSAPKLRVFLQDVIVLVFRAARPLVEQRRSTRIHCISGIAIWVAVVLIYPLVDSLFRLVVDVHCALPDVGGG